MRKPRRRRLEKKTDYKARFTLLKSGKTRLVARKSNRYIIAQLVETEQAQDKVLGGVTSKLLLNKKWPEKSTGSLKSLQASYLTGLLIGKLAKEKNVSSAIFDIGMNRNVHKSRLYALLKGALDSGLKIAHDPKALPTDQDIQKNEKLKDLIKKLKEEI